MIYTPPVTELGEQPENTVFERISNHDMYVVFVDDEKIGEVSGLHLAQGRVVIDWDIPKIYPNGFPTPEET